MNGGLVGAGRRSTASGAVLLQPRGFDDDLDAVVGVLMRSVHNCVDPIVGRYVQLYSTCNTASSTTLTASRMYLLPYFCPKNLVLDRLSTHTGAAAVASSAARMGVYESNPMNGYPQRLLGSDVGTVATTANSTDCEIATWIPQVGGRLYWWAIGGGSANLPQLSTYVGASMRSIAGTAAVTGNNFAHAYVDSVAGAFPNTIDASSVNFTNASTPWIGARVGAVLQ